MAQTVFTHEPQTDERTAALVPPTPRTTWPDAVAYQESLQTPANALRDAALVGATITKGRMGLPLTYSGRFAVVFRATDASGKAWALRCFTSDGGGDAAKARTERYNGLAQFLQSAPPAARAHFVPFRYVESGVSVGGRSYPLLLMGWNDDAPLGKWLETHLYNARLLRRLCRTLADLLTDLEAADISHGDFQHDNLLISSDGRRVCLVDYDGVWVPPLQHAAKPNERGHANYQHPRRTAADYGPKNDRFACLVLQTALVALAVDPTLWETFSDGESVLFKQSDLQSPETSPVFASLRLIAYSDPLLSRLLTQLAQVCLVAPGDVPVVPADTFGPVEAVMETEPTAILPANVTPFRAAQTQASETAAQVSDGHKWWVQTSRKAVKRKRTWMHVHRISMWACVAWIIAWFQSQGDAGAIYLFGPYLLAVLLAVGYYLWPTNLAGLSLMERMQKNQDKLNRVTADLYNVQSHLKRVQENPANRSVIAFVGEALQNTLLANITAEVGMTETDLLRLSTVGVRRLSEVSDPLPIPLDPLIVSRLQVARHVHQELARKEFEALSGVRRTLQRETTRLQTEKAELEKVAKEMEREADKNGGASFGHFLGYLLGG